MLHTLSCDWVWKRGTTLLALQQVVDEDFDFDFIEPSSTARAMAALEADPNLKVT
jgi:hypothetical protein